MGDRYNPLFELGAGSFGKAWVVRDNKTQKKHVSKVIQIKGLSSEALDNCVTEVAVLSACCHANIVRYIEAFVCGGALHIVMEYASGGDLQQKIERQKGELFSSDMILEWFLQVILALEYIHSKNILHRDLKPQNIFLTDNGVVKLGDFGIARVLNSCDDLASTRIGTPFYISPEICTRKPYNSKSDMWAAGCLLYQMSTLCVPFHASNFDDLSKKIIKAQYDPISSQFQEIVKIIISKLLVVNPDNRLSSPQLLKLEPLHGMVLYLKNRSRPQIQGSRTRSSSLVTERSRLNLYPKARSTSANRLGRDEAGDQNVILCKQPKDISKARSTREKRLVHNLTVDQNEISCKHSEDISKEWPTSENRLVCNSTRDNDVILHRQSEDISKGLVRNKNVTSYNSDKTKTKGKSEQQKCYNDGIKSNEDSVKGNNTKQGNIQCMENHVSSSVRDRNVMSVGNRNITSISNEADRNKTIEKSKWQEDAEHKTTINTKTFTIKDSVVRRLSEASPKLSETVRKQRLRLSVNEPDALQKIDLGKGCSSGITDNLRDEVFESPDDDKHKHKHRIDSTTYVVKQKGQSDSNNNSMTSVGHREIKEGDDKINTAMIQALSVFKFNKQFTKKLLHDKIKRELGDIRCEQMITQVRQLIVEDGHSYFSLSEKLSKQEKNLIPLVCMYLIS